MDLNQEIRSHFATSRPGSAIPVTCLGDEYRAWVIRLEDEYGVAFSVKEGVEISERFSSARIWTAQMEINKESLFLLMLTCHDDQLRLEFASICAQFVDPGEEGSERKFIAETPIEWWKRWRNLLGNSIREKSPYAVLGELLTVLKLMENGESPEWTGGNGGVNDVISRNAEYEVKSTTMRYESIVSISGQFQLKHKGTDKLNLIFCRFEESSAGESIDEAVNLLVSKGYDKSQLENTMNKLGFEAGCSDRKRKYKMLEARRYVVDDKFPSITPQSFIGGNIPPGIIQITYRLDLTGLEYADW